MRDHGLLMTALPSKNAAEKLARTLIKERLAACVQMSGIESVYVWKGETVKAAETLLLIKTRTALFEAAIARIKVIHPYSVPEIVGTEFTAGFGGYFNWIDEATGPRAAKKPEEKKPKPVSKNNGQVSARTNAKLRPGVIRRMRKK